jgi:NAD-dependent dihydropyrimidine dehydrogenase PreA subunit
MNDKRAVMAFSPNDFIYYSVNELPTKEECDISNTEIMTNGVCDNSNTFIENRDECIKLALCENRKKAELLLQKQKDSGIDIRFQDMKQLYDIEKLNIFNYSLGIIIVGTLIIHDAFFYMKG